MFIPNYSRLQCQTFQTWKLNYSNYMLTVMGVLHDFMPIDLDDMPSLEDITDEES